MRSWSEFLFFAIVKSIFQLHVFRFDTPGPCCHDVEVTFHQALAFSAIRSNRMRPPTPWGWDDARGTPISEEKYLLRALVCPGNIYRVNHSPVRDLSIRFSREVRQRTRQAPRTNLQDQLHDRYGGRTGKFLPDCIGIAGGPLPFIQKDYERDSRSRKGCEQVPGKSSSGVEASARRRAPSIPRVMISRANSNRSRGSRRDRSAFRQTLSCQNPGQRLSSRRRNQLRHASTGDRASG